MEDLWERLDAMRNGGAPVQQGRNISQNLQQRLDNMRKGRSAATNRTSSGSSAPNTTTSVGASIWPLGAPNSTNTPVGGGVPDAPKNNLSVGRGDHTPPQTSPQSTSTKPLTGFAAGVQANNEGYRALAEKKMEESLTKTEQPLTGFAAGVQANNDGYRRLAEKPSLGNYVWRKAVGGGADTIEGVANAAGYWQQAIQKSGEIQANNALRHAAATAKEPETKKYMESYLKAQGISPQQAGEVAHRPTQAYANFGDNYVAKTEEKFADADFGFVGNLMGDVAQGVGGMLVRMPARFLPGLGEVITFASAYGNAKQSALKNGAIESEAATYALGTATVELATEKMFGFVGSLGGGAADNALTWFVNKVARSEAGKAALNTILGALGEGAEEFIAEYGQAYIDKLTTKMDERSLQEVNQDAWYNALVSGITSVLFGTADIISGGNGKLPTAEDLESVTTQAAEETVSSIANETSKKQTNIDTAINDNPAEHTSAEQAVIERYKAASDASLRGFIEKVRGLVNNDYKNKIRHVLNTETDRALVEAQKLTGTDTSDFMQIIKGNTIQHIDKRHGIDGEADHSMANIDDFSRINFVLDNFTDARIIPITEADPETRKLSGEWNNADGTPAPLVQYSMPINGTYYVVEAIPASKAKVMAVVSAYISSKTKGSTLNQELSLAEKQPGNLTPKTVPEILHTSKPNIPQAKNKVNDKVTDGQFPFLYMERLLEQAKKNGNVYAEKILKAQIEKAQKTLGKTDADANAPMPTLYADYMRKHNMLEGNESVMTSVGSVENESKGFENTIESSIIDIDELTPCLRRMADDRIVDTVVCEVTPTYDAFFDWEFDWTVPEKNGFIVRAIKAVGDDRIQGMIALKADNRNSAVLIDIVEAAPFNNPHNPQFAEKEYSGVGGHLFAEAVRESYERGYDGYVYFKAKSGLIDYYHNAFGAVLINPRERIMAIEEGSARKLYDKYYMGR